jgi:hypothetical protein
LFQIQAGDLRKPNFILEHPFRRYEFKATSIEDKAEWLNALALASQENIHTLDLIQEATLVKEITPVNTFTHFLSLAYC